MSFSICHLSLHYNNTPLLHDLSFTLQPGEIVALLGANGIGKSSLCQTLAGNPPKGIQITSGEFFLDELEVHKSSAKILARRRAFLSQNNTLSFDLSIKDIVAMGLYPFPEIRQPQVFIEQALHWVHASNLISRSYTTLSGGEQQRIHLARILVQLLAQGQVLPNTTPYCFLDEPTSNLDPKYQHQILHVLRQFAQQYRVGILVVLHDINLASFYADRLILLAQGKLYAQGPVQEVLTPSNLHATYGIEPHVIPHPFAQGKYLVVFGKG